MRRELASACPSDVWCDAGIWFVVFDARTPLGSSIVFLVGGGSRVLSISRLTFDHERNALLVADTAGKTLLAMPISHDSREDAT